MYRLCLAASAALMLAAAGPAGAATAPAPTMLVLDASNSMWGQIGGVSKFDIARKSLASFVGALPAGQPIGLTAYGHRRKDDCLDVETVLPVGVLDKSRLDAALKPLAPRGKTPLARAIAQAAETLDYKKQPATVVVLTDGLETCSANPCAEVEQLVAQGRQLTVHIIGFDMRATEREQLRCIAQAGHGRLALAGNAQELALALANVHGTAAVPEAAGRKSAALHAAPAAPRAGAQFEVTWDGAAMDGDSVTLSLPEVPLGGGAGFSYLKKTGKAVVTAPETPGAYELRYLDKKGGKPLGTLALTVEPAEAFVTPPPTVPGNKPFLVKWGGPANRGDMIYLVEGKKQLAYANPTKGSDAKLRAPARSGEFEVVYQTQNGKVLATQRVTVAMEPIVLRLAGLVAKGKPFTVAFTGSVGDGDVVSYTPVVDPHASGRTYYNAIAGSPAKLVAPTVAGKYEIQYKNDGVLLATLPLIVQ
ncbi:VWA domain-containing protein [Massilia arenosa]|uniref:VWA domain-containing protein n=1 Tax=Zemynaea arenosa TaxID=2561931 RepID=A0A4Y9SS75_9BURK|nr:VWA domain-containing protein [Massilia arenosa]TFW28189.1 VWA domain-containing protein [Massilia arenosa]